MNQQNLFAGEDNFSSTFINGLEQMLESDELGAFILVLANASFDKPVYDSLVVRLEQRFVFWQQRFKEDDGIHNSFAPDDVAVFERLMQTGFDNLQLTRKRMAGIWQLQFNQLRSFRPPRNADSRFNSIFKEFEVDGFHFNKPFLQKEVLWEGVVREQSLRLLYNKFPFAPLHGLLVINPQENRPQQLTRVDHEFIWEWLESLDGALPMAVAFNSLGAYSSVNHQHFQTFVSRRKLPVELGCWRHNGGTQGYPLSCRRFISHADGWEHIQRLHQSDLPYNLMYRAGEMYLVGRRFQGSYEHADWTGGFAWAESMGAVTLVTENDFETLDETMITSEMKKLFQP